MMDDSVIRDATHRIFSDLADPHEATAAQDEVWKESLWRALEDAGLTLAWVPEEAGGVGASLADGFDIIRVSGRFAAPAPLAETLLAGWMLSAAGVAPPPGPVALAPIREGDRLRRSGDGRLSGRLRAAPFAAAPHLAAFVETDDGGAVALLDQSAISAEARAVDLGAERADLVLDGASPIAIAPAPSDLTRERIMAMGAVARTQQIAGALETILAVTTDYVQQRVAFGRPIAKFQAVQHNLARLAGEVAAALTAASSSADTLAQAHAGAPLTAADVFLEVASAKIRAGEAATEGAAIAHQAHGAIGFTSEYLLQRYTRAIWGWRDDFGGESHWALALGRQIVADGPDGLWTALTRR